MAKICKKCNIAKTDFYVQVRRHDGLHPWCKDCCKDYQKLNQAKANLRTANWRLRNPEQNKALDKKYKKVHKKERSEYNTAYHAKRRKEDPSFKIAGNLRNRVRLALLNDKLFSTSKNLGCSVKELKLYIESKFQPGMTWDNYGVRGWHIDHIKPLCSFDLTNQEQFKQACHYTNLQPLWVKDHNTKTSKDIKLSLRQKEVTNGVR